MACHDNPLKKTKTYLRSTLLSHKGSITTSQLDNDYRQLVGDYIPYSQLQYRDLNSFLSSIPDVCRVECEGGLMVVRGVAGKASAHIQDMVARQKVKSEGGRKYRGYGGGGGGVGGGRGGRHSSNYRYNNNYNFDLSDGSDWESYNIKTKVGERAKLEVVKAVPAGFEDSADDYDNFSAYSCVPSYSAGAEQNKSTVHDIKEESSLTKSDPIIPPLPPGQAALPHSGPLPPSPLSSRTTYTDITVSKVSSPHQFSVQPLGSKHLYHSLSEQMNKHYYTTSTPRNVPAETLEQGCVVAVKYRGSWFRAEVTTFLRSHFLVCLRLVDTGKMIICTSRQDIQPLCSVFGELPVQAVRARLDGVRPSSASSWWQVETDWFRETVMGKDWVGVIKKVEREQQDQTVLVMKLFDTIL